MAGQYAARKARGWRVWSRARKALVITAALATVATVAVAAILMFRAEIGGSATVSVADIEFTGTPAVMATSGKITCAPTVASGKMTLNITNAFPDSRCDVAARVIRTGSEIEGGIRIQDVTFNNAIPTVFVQGCGVTVPASTTSNNVVVRFSVPTDAVAGSFPADAEAGIIAVANGDYDDLACPRA
jgi:hypothetical protein